MTFYSNFSSPVSVGNKEEITERVSEIIKQLSIATEPVEFVAVIDRRFWRRLMGRKQMQKLHQKRLQYLRRKGARK